MGTGVGVGDGTKVGVLVGAMVGVEVGEISGTGESPHAEIITVNPKKTITHRSKVVCTAKIIMEVLLMVNLARFYLPC
jgi:hypothetical protein